MTAIGLDQPQGLQLHSCPSCGRHSWRSGAREVDRAELLATLQVEKARAAGQGRPDEAAAVARAPVDEEARRSELQQMLSRFTVHGTTS